MNNTDSYIVLAEIVGLTSCIRSMGPEQIIVGIYGSLEEATKASFTYTDTYLMLLLDATSENVSIKVKLLDAEMKTTATITSGNDVIVYSVSIMKLNAIQLTKGRPSMATPDYIYEYLLSEFNVVIGRIQCLDESLERNDLLETVKDCRESVKRMREMNKKSE